MVSDLKFHGPETEIGQAYDFFFSSWVSEEEKSRRVFRGVYGNVPIYEVIDLAGIGGEPNPS